VDVTWMSRFHALENDTPRDRGRRFDLHKLLQQLVLPSLELGLLHSEKFLVPLSFFLLGPSDRKVLPLLLQLLLGCRDNRRLDVREQRGEKRIGLDDS